MTPKPFQTNELTRRVKSLLEPKSATPAPIAERSSPSNALSSLFSPPPAPAAPRPVAPPPPASATLESAWPRALAEAFIPRQPSQPHQGLQHSTTAPVPPAPTPAHVQNIL